MRSASFLLRSFKPSLSFGLLVLLLAVLWLAGGTSRDDQLGQPLVRGAAWLLLIVALLFGRRRPTFEARPVWWLLLAMIVLAVAQLVPLPPALWEALPGRGVFTQAATVAGTAQPWRPWSIVPSATLNALSSLIIPFAVLVLASSVRQEERRWLPALVLIVIVTALLVGLLQLSGVVIDNPFIDDVPGEVSGIFANRNHFALLLAFGILIVPAWAFPDGQVAAWRWPAAVAFDLLFFLAILATGSRAGMMVGIVALVIGLVLARGPLKRRLAHYPRWLLPALLVAAVAMVASIVAISLSADRAVSIQRLVTLNPEEDVRRTALPTIWAMVGVYFPFGTGLGDFATLFQVHEPFALLNTTYLNRAHDDYLEILVNSGLFGSLLLLAALIWWLMASLRAWRPEWALRQVRPRLGSAMLLLVFIASLSDYPARTPMMMAMIALAALWLSWGGEPLRTALPPENQRL